MRNFCTLAFIRLLQTDDITKDITNGKRQFAPFRYVLSKGTASSWQVARDACRISGGDLAVPTSHTINQYIYNLLRRKGIDKAFIGLYRVHWSVPGSPFYTVFGAKPSFTKWHNGEPSNSGGREGCTELVHRASFWGGGDHGGEWNDLPCTGYSRHYVCQLQVHSPRK